MQEGQPQRTLPLGEWIDEMSSKALSVKQIQKLENGQIIDLVEMNESLGEIINKDGDRNNPNDPAFLFSSLKKTYKHERGFPENKVENESQFAKGFLNDEKVKWDDETFVWEDERKEIEKAPDGSHFVTIKGFRYIKWDDLKQLPWIVFPKDRSPKGSPRKRPQPPKAKDTISSAPPSTDLYKNLPVTSATKNPEPTPYGKMPPSMLYYEKMPEGQPKSKGASPYRPIPKGKDPEPIPMPILSAVPSLSVAPKLNVKDAKSEKESIYGSFRIKPPLPEKSKEAIDSIKGQEAEKEKEENEKKEKKGTTTGTDDRKSTVQDKVDGLIESRMPSLPSPIEKQLINLNEKKIQLNQWELEQKYQNKLLQQLLSRLDKAILGIDVKGNPTFRQYVMDAWYKENDNVFQNQRVRIEKISQIHTRDMVQGLAKEVNEQEEKIRKELQKQGNETGSLQSSLVQNEQRIEDDYKNKMIKMMVKFEQQQKQEFEMDQQQINENDARWNEIVKPLIQEPYNPSSIEKRKTVLKSGSKATIDLLNEHFKDSADQMDRLVQLHILNVSRKKGKKPMEDKGKKTKWDGIISNYLKNNGNTIHLLNLFFDGAVLNMNLLVQEYIEYRKTEKQRKE